MTGPYTPTGSPAAFAGVGKLEFAPTNGADDLFPTWVDITTRIEGEVSITRGRQSELNSVEASQLTCTLKNFDSAFTFGYTGGPYGANWSPAKQIRYTETHGPWTKVIFQGWIEYPDIPEWKPIGQQYVQLSATDRLARLSRGRTFVSTLTEYIRFNGGTALKYYWPCLDGATPFRNLLSSDGTPNLTVALAAGSNGFVSTGGVDAVTPNGSTNVLTDDVNAALITSKTGVDGSGRTIPTSDDVIQINQTTPAPPFIALATGDVVTLVCWYRPQLFQNNVNTILFQMSDTQGVSLSLYCLDAAGTLQVQSFGTLTGTLTGKVLPNQAWTPIAIRYGWNTAALELWIGSSRYTTTLAGTPAGSNSLITVNTSFANYFNGGFAHAQIYAGPATSWGFTDYLAQITAAGSGLEGRTTGQRINTMLDYAGVPSGKRQVDPGQSYMQVAGLAGQSPLDALENAASTERGRLFVSGDDRVVFHDRIRTYNV